MAGRPAEGLLAGRPAGGGVASLRMGPPACQLAALRQPPCPMRRLTDPPHPVRRLATALHRPIGPTGIWKPHKMFSWYIPGIPDIYHDSIYQVYTWDIS